MNQHRPKQQKNAGLLTCLLNKKVIPDIYWRTKGVEKPTGFPFYLDDMDSIVIEQQSSLNSSTVNSRMAAHANKNDFNFAGGMFMHKTGDPRNKNTFRFSLKLP